MFSSTSKTSKIPPVAVVGDLGTRSRNVLCTRRPPAFSVLH